MGKEQYRRKGGEKGRGEEEGHSSFSCRKLRPRGGQTGHHHAKPKPHSNFDFNGYVFFFLRAFFCLCFCALGMHPVLGAGPASRFRRRVTGRVPPGPRTGCQRGGPASPARGRRGCRREAATRGARWPAPVGRRPPR